MLKENTHFSFIDIKKTKLKYFDKKQRERDRKDREIKKYNE